MPNADDNHNKSVVVQLVEDPIVADTQSIAMVGAAQFRHTRRPWLIGQPIDDRCEPLPRVRRKFPELPSRGRAKFDPVDHAIQLRDRALT